MSKKKRYNYIIMARIMKIEGNKVTIEDTFDLRGDMLEAEENIVDLFGNKKNETSLIN